MLSPGDRLGPYEVVSPLGAGGMGEVYRARDPRLGREVAVKVIRDGSEASPERRRRFEDEARAVAALSHPNVLTVHDVGVHEGKPYLVLELLEGETLRSSLQRSPLTPRRALEVAIDVGRGLDELGYLRGGSDGAALAAGGHGCDSYSSRRRSPCSVRSRVRSCVTSSVPR